MLQSKTNILFINTNPIPPYLVQHPKVDSSFQTKAVYKNLGTAYTDSYSKTSCNLLTSFIILRMPPLQPLHKAYRWPLALSANGIEAMCQKPQKCVCID